MDPRSLLAKLVDRQHLTTAETRALFEALMDGQLDPPAIAALLTALAAKGESVDEIVGAAEAMRDHVTRVTPPAGAPVIDTCGTGGDGKPVFNVSTAAAIVAAAAGATVAKHGNRSNARPSGSAEVLAALGVNVDADVPTVERCLADCRVAFLFALHLHPAMKHAAPIRRSLGFRTIFNLVGPVTNPAGARRQLLGVSRIGDVERMAEALRRLGAERAMVVHGLDGICDLSITSATRVARWDGQRMHVEEVTCAVIDAAPARLEELFIRSADESAAVIGRVLDGHPGPQREMVVFNAAGALWVAGVASDWGDGAERARAAIDSGAARRTLAAWAQASR